LRGRFAGYSRWVNRVGLGAHPECPLLLRLLSNREVARRAVKETGRELSGLSRSLADLTVPPQPRQLGEVRRHAGLVADRPIGRPECGGSAYDAPAAIWPPVRS
jgi:hypothetical protein